MFLERCVGDRTDMPIVLCYEDAFFQKRIDTYLTRMYETQVPPELNIDSCLFGWPYEQLCSIVSPAR